MRTVATWVASLPGAVGRLHAFGIGPLLIGTGGLLVLCLLRSPLRWSGVAMVVVCILGAWSSPRPDILVSADAGMVAVRDASGVLRLIASRRDDFALREWLAADGDARATKDESLTQGTRCDQTGCVARLADGRAVALSLSAEALAEDCEIAALVVTARNAPPACTAPIIDRNAARAGGAMAGRWNGKALVLEAARPAGFERPWTANRPWPAVAAPQTTTSAPRDATPRPTDLDADDAPSIPSE